MNELCEIIRRETAAHGPISFARFMELSLYCPELGYYERLSNNPGRRGDFYTSVSVGPLFGELLAFHFAPWLGECAARSAQRGSGPAPSAGVQLVEAGAHRGQLSADILKALKSRHPRVFDRLEYWILEPSPRRRQWQQKELAPFGAKIRWFDSWDGLPPGGVSGIIFSNELLDAMPVRRFGWDAQEKKWFEWAVSWDAGHFVWQRLPFDSSIDNSPSATCGPVQRSPFLVPAWESLLAVLPDGFTTETSPAAAMWWRRAAASLTCGRLLAFDYGLSAGEFLLPQRANGTLRAYHRHRLNDDVLARVGEQDITAHVNFTALQSAGESVGLKTEGLLAQAEFLTGIATRTWTPESGFGEWTPNRTRQFQTLTHPEHLGRRFQVLIQSR